jgi:hypothetical protein
MFIPPAPPLPNLRGPSHLWIAGEVTDYNGRPVAGASVTGYGAMDGTNFECRYATGELEAETDGEGRYIAQWRRDPGGTFGGCLFLIFTPPEGSGLATKSMDSMRVTFYHWTDPELRTDTVFVDAVLPQASDS